MAHKFPVVNVRIAADLLTEIRSLPFPPDQKTTTKKVSYLIRLGAEHVKSLEDEGKKGQANT